MRRTSKWYEVAGVLILKWTVSPTLTLISVANPWMVESPEKLIDQSLEGVPGREFSQPITLTRGGPQGLVASTGIGRIDPAIELPTASVATDTSATAWRERRLSRSAFSRT